MQAYKALLKDILENGTVRKDRTGFGTISKFGAQIRFNLKEGFPAITVKPLYFKTMVTETLWFLKGTGDVSYLKENNCKIWDEWTHPELNSVGPMYPVQLRNFTTGTDLIQIDQLANAINLINKDPYSRRNVVSYWNPLVLPDTNLSPIENVAEGQAALAACHTLFQLYTEDKSIDEIIQDTDFDTINRLFNDLIIGQVIPINDYSVEDVKEETIHYLNTIKETSEENLFTLLDQYGIAKRKVSLHLYIRSADVGIGTPFNIAQYALLLSIICRITHTTPKDLIISFGDAHIYLNQVENVKTMLEREPLNAPTLEINPELKTLEDFTEKATNNDFTLKGYESHAALPKVAIAV